MKITVLLENRSRREDMLCAHGLSLYIEAGERKLLLDMGPDEKFIENAKVLGIDLSAVDTAFLSHSHDDHSGGLEAFCRVNGKAKIYMEKEAFGDYYADKEEGRVYAGIDPALMESLRERIVFSNGRTQLDPAVTLFSDVRGDRHVPANDGLLELRRGIFMQDDFRHEQNIIITEGSKRVLFTGCAHRGIVNILQRAEEIIGRTPDAVVGGFHLSSPATGEMDEQVVDAVTEEFGRRDCLCCTGHCTGIAGHRVLHNALGERCKYLFCGKTIEI